MWSDELYRIYGLDPSQGEVTFERFSEHIHPDDRALAEETIRGAMSPKPSVDMTVSVQ